MRLLIPIMLAVMLSGCATEYHVVDSTMTGVRTQPCMIIPAKDIEPSEPDLAKVKISSAKPEAVTCHTVKVGETLWAISRLYNVDLITLAKANSISDTGSIEAGQALVIPGAHLRKTVKNINYIPRRRTTFVWPVKGDIASRFGSKVDTIVNKGIDIRAVGGMDVVASRGGKVVYCDPHFKGFGQTVIIDHLDGFQTVYSYNANIFVRAGDIVAQRDVIARVGSSGRASEPMLHFEIRKNGEPQNPEFFLSR